MATKVLTKRKCECGGDVFQPFGVWPTGSPRYCRAQSCIDARKAIRTTRAVVNRKAKPARQCVCGQPGRRCRNLECVALRVRQRNEKRAAKLAAKQQQQPPPVPLRRGRPPCTCGQCPACLIRAGNPPPRHRRSSPESKANRLCRCGGDVWRVVGTGKIRLCRASQCRRSRQAAREQGTAPLEKRRRPCCRCGICPACLERARQRDERLGELQRAAESRAAEIAMCALLAGAEPTPLRPIKIRALCQKCGAGVPKQVACCTRCSAIERQRIELESYFPRLTGNEKTQRQLYQPLPDEEVSALALCDTDGDAQAVMDKIIARETARIREHWTDQDYYDRARADPQKSYHSEIGF
jgi:hypothetical protein